MWLMRKMVILGGFRAERQSALGMEFFANFRRMCIFGGNERGLALAQVSNMVASRALGSTTQLRMRETKPCPAGGVTLVLCVLGSKCKVY